MSVLRFLQPGGPRPGSDAGETATVRKIVAQLAALEPD